MVRERSDSVRLKSSYLSTREQSRRELHPFIRPWICSAIIGITFLLGKLARKVSLRQIINVFFILAAVLCTDAFNNAGLIQKKPILFALSGVFFLIAIIGLFFTIQFLVKHGMVCSIYLDICS